MIEGLKTASFKGQQFLVQSARVSFGQKTVVKKFPNANRTEVEFLGEDADAFSLTCIINDTNFSAYKQKRDNFKRLLKEPSAGLLIHPVEGNIQCAVVGLSELDEPISGSFGIATFTVTFLRYNNPAFPKEASLNIQKIVSLADGILAQTQKDFASFYSITSARTFDQAFARVGTFCDFYEATLGKVSVNPLKISEAITQIRSINANAGSLVSNGSTFGSQLQLLFTKSKNVAADNTSQMAAMQYMGEFEGDDELSTLKDSYYVREMKRNDNLLVNTVRVSSLALQYQTATLIDYTNSDQLSAIEQSLQDQFETIMADNTVTVDTQSAMITLRTEVSKFFESKREMVADVENIDVLSFTNITSLSYAYYGTTDKDEQLLDINRLVSSQFIKGETKVLTNVDN